MERPESWVGQAWIETVTVESRPKVEVLLNEVKTQHRPRSRQVNYHSAHGVDVPIVCSAVQVHEQGPVLIVGRDLRNIAALQQRLVDAQQLLEQDYARLRSIETRYRLLFQISAESVLLIDAAMSRIVDANPAACTLFAEPAKAMVGKPFPRGFNAAGMQTVQALLDGVRITGRTDEVRAYLAADTGEVFVSAYLFRQEHAPFFLIRVREATAVPSRTQSSRDAILVDVIDRGPDGIVVTRADGHVLSANDTFLQMSELSTEEQTRGETLDRWLGKPGVELNVLIATLRQRGVVRLFPTTLHGEYGTETEVEVSAVSVIRGDQTCYAFSIRDVGPRPAVDAGGRSELPQSADHLTELVGRMPLREIIRDSTDVIERLCIQTALELCRDNRAQAAEMLGLSRQSLYVKLRRFGLAESEAEPDKRD